MSQSLYTSMGGISAAQQQINVVSNNIANLNTTGFKESEVTFQDLFSTTMTAGNAPTVTTGGKNPVQVGLGVQVGSIARNFQSGTWVSTGRTTDMMIQGNGFYTVRSSDGQMFLTKAGNFTFDSSGDLVTTQGYKVVGADQVYNTISSTSNVNIPQKIVTDVVPNAGMATKLLTDLNNSQITSGDFTINVTPKGGGIPLPVNIVLTPADNTMALVTTAINNQLGDAATKATNDAATAQGLVDAATTTKQQALDDLAAGNIDQATCDAIVAVQDPIINTQTAIVTAKTAEAASMSNVSAVCDDTTGGTIQFKMDGVEATKLEFIPGTSNFVIATQLGSSSNIGNTYTSKVLDFNVNVTPVTALTSAVSVSNYTIAPDGSIEATYSNGDKLTIETAADKSAFQFKYTTSTGVIIRGTDVHVNPGVAKPANFQLQLANVVNPEGLVSMGGNLFMTGPNAGDMLFTVGGAMGVGQIKSGGLESSNVDLSKQLSDMILAQRSVQANSRVFSTTSSIMQTLVQLGQ